MLNTNSGNLESVVLPPEDQGLTKAFLDVCAEIFNHRKNIELTKKDADYKSIHKSISSIIRMHMNLEQAMAFAENRREVIYIMTAMADEIFLNIEWDGKAFWEENILEQHFFGTQIAGELIFRKIDEILLKNETVSLEKAEIYLRALALGFKGKYRGTPEELPEISVYRSRLFEFIERKDTSITSADLRLFQKEYTFTIPTISRKMLPDSSIINYVSAFFVFMFLVISSFVWIFETRDIRALMVDISKIALRE